MTNINVKVVGTANLAQMTSEFSKLQAQVVSLNAQLGQMVSNQKSVDPAGYQRLAKAAAYNSKIFRDAAASTGMFEVQQIRLNSATDEYVKKLKAQKIGFRELIRTRKIANAAYREQLAMENMAVRRGPASNSTGKETFDVITPKRYAAELDTAGRRLSFLNEQLKSGAHQMVNWGKNTQWAGRQLMVGFTMPILAFGAAAGVMAYQIDSELTRVAKVYDTTADSTSSALSDVIAVEKELMEVRKAGMATAITAAREYGQAGTDTIAVQAELAATGKTGLELQRSTMEVMRIARLGEVEYQTATEATIALQSIFRMSNDDLTESFNYMNAIENATSLSTKDFAEAIPIAASAVKTWGGDVKELGILLTAMKENGIGASEGANAIKATLQRLARPSKQVREEWAAITGTDITQIVDNAESLSDVFTQIFHATEDLDDAAKRKAFAGLFGSYQVSRMMALTKGMGELEEGVGQVSDAYAIAGKAPEQWATTAENEMKRYKESISGQFKSALEEVKLQLATLGGPFVEAATSVLEVFSKLINGFNNMPDFAKKFIAISTVIAAIAGPVVMLTGLFANLIGNGLKSFAGFLTVINRLGTSMNILDKENRIAAASASLMEKGYVSQTTAVKGLTLELEKLAKAQRVANTYMAAANASGALGTAPVRLTKGAKQLADARAREAYMQQQRDTLLAQGPSGKIFHAVPDTDMQASRAFQDQHAMGLLQTEAKKMNEEFDKGTKTSSKIARNSAFIGNNLARAAGSAGVMGAGMALTMLNSEGTANSIGQMLILGSVIAPAAMMLAGGLKMAYTWAKGVNVMMALTALQSKAATAVLASTTWLKWSAAVGSTSTKMGALARFLPMMVSPIGLIGAAVAVVGVGLFAWYQHMKKAREEQTAMHKNLNNMAASWASNMGLVRKEYEKIASVQMTIDEQTKYGKYKEAFQSGDLKEEMAAFTDEDLTDVGRLNAAADTFASLQRDFGLSAADAAIAIRAMYDAAGYGSIAATDAVTELMEKLGTINAMENLDLQTKMMGNLTTGSEEWIDAGNDVGLAFAQGIAEADPGVASAEIMAKFTSTINDMWSDVFTQADTGMLATKFAEVGIGDGTALREAISRAGSATALIDELFNDGVTTQSQKDLMYAQLGEQVSAVQAAEKSFFDGITGENGLDIDGRINSLYAFENSVESLGVAMKALPADRARELFEIAGNPDLDAMNAYMQEFRGLDLALAGASESTKLMAGNAWLAANGFKEVDTYAELAAIAAGKVEPEVDGAKGAIDQAASATRRWAAAFNFSPEQAISIARDAMNATQQMIADDYSTAYGDMLDGQLQAEQDTWDQRVEAAGNAGERAKAALDAKWERKNDAAEKYWEQRIGLVDKAIEAEEKAEAKREKMFDAEIARIQKLNDLANSNIDFNVLLNEGKLDEAAKLRNDLQAAADTQAMERARAKAGTKSERRIEKLGNKKERLEKQRDAAMEAMQKLEEAQKAHLDRMTQANQAAVEAQRDAAIKAKEAEVEAQRKLMEESIEVFMSGTAAEKAEMKKRMQKAGLSYKWFQENVIEPKGLKWGEYFGDKLQSELKKSAEEIRNDAMWEQMGADTLEGMARGMGFSGKKSLMHFLKTGEIKDFHENKPAGATTAQQQKNEDMLTRHEGGPIGPGGSNSRKGVARTYKGIHPSETLVRAQKGEFMISKEAYKKNPAAVEALNAGEYDRVNRIKNGKGGGGQGPATFFGAAFTRAMAGKTSEALGAAVVTKKAQMAAAVSALASGSPYFGGAGHYSLPGVKPWVLEAANYLGGKFGIASIGGVGTRSNNSTSDHPKGLALDFMTGTDVGKGNALANEALRLSGVLDATYMIWQKRIHSFDSRGWQPYSHPSGQSSPTLDHMDHVHLSFTAAGKAGDLPKPAAAGTGGPVPTYGPGNGPGPGGLSRASTPGKGWNTAHDYRNGLRSPIYAIANGHVTSQTFPPSAGSGEHPNAYPRGYGSYGVMATLASAAGNVRYAHLWPGSVRTGPVSAGDQIGLSAATGNASGPHTHFEVNGSTNAQGLFASMGIPLRKGAAKVRFDNTLANLHAGERVLTADLSSKMDAGMTEYFANGGGDEYTVIVNPSAGMDEDRLANKVVKKIEKKRRRRPVTRTVG